MFHARELCLDAEAVRNRLRVCKSPISSKPSRPARDGLRIAGRHPPDVASRNLLSLRHANPAAFKTRTAARRVVAAAKVESLDQFRSETSMLSECQTRRRSRRRNGVAATLNESDELHHQQQFLGPRSCVFNERKPWQGAPPKTTSISCLPRLARRWRICHRARRSLTLAHIVAVCGKLKHGWHEVDRIDFDGGVHETRLTKAEAFHRPAVGRFDRSTEETYWGL